MIESPILYRTCSSLKVGELTRYQISYQPSNDMKDQPDALSIHPSLWLSVKNTEPLPLRAAVLRGPYLLYVDVRTEEYHHNTTTFITADQPKFAANLQPSQHFTAELSCHVIKDTYVWIVDVVSQILFSPGTDVGYEITIANTKKGLKTHINEQGVFNNDLLVNVLDTIDLWNLPVPVKQKKYHLVLLTHGLHSNTYADMFYIKEQIDRLAKETDQNIIVRGFNGNVCKTEKGIRYLGSRLAEFIVNDVYQENINKVSFIGHSLGGLIQTFAIAYIQLNFPWFFDKVEPINFITMASPLLGIVNENPSYVKAALYMGAVGRTGSELGLESSSNGGVPLLKLLPTGPAHHILRRFRNRTLYANSINDGIVPLYTSALVFVDWKAINDVSDLQEVENANTQNVGRVPVPFSSASNSDNGLLQETARTLIDPVQKVISLLAPSLQRSPISSRPYLEDPSSSLNINNFPKASVLESAASVLIPPFPPLKYLTDPASRPSVIIHDRVYSENDLPPRKLKKKKSFMETLDPLSKYQELEEDIARQWHRGMDWRKVLVKLEPDAHNNIIVRRRFVNGFGWAVIDHLVENHFKDVEGVINSSNMSSNDNCSFDNQDNEENSSLISLMDRSRVSKENQLIDNDLNAPMKNVDSITSFDATDPLYNEDYNWINSKIHDTMFDVGPAGMLSNFNEMLDTFKNWGNFGSVPSTSTNRLTSRDHVVQGGEVIDDDQSMTLKTNFAEEIEDNDISRLQDTIIEGNYY